MAVFVGMVIERWMLHCNVCGPNGERQHFGGRLHSGIHPRGLQPACKSFFARPLVTYTGSIWLLDMVNILKCWENIICVCCVTDHRDWRTDQEARERGLVSAKSFRRKWQVCISKPDRYSIILSSIPVWACRVRTWHVGSWAILSTYLFWSDTRRHSMTDNWWTCHDRPLCAVVDMCHLAIGNYHNLVLWASTSACRRAPRIYHLLRSS